VKGTGYRPVPENVREDLWHMHPRAQRAGASPDTDLTKFASPVDDQDGVGQCTGEAVVCGVHATLGAAGVPVAKGYLDPQALYRLARCMERAYDYPWPGGSPPPLRDEGSDPNLVHLALARWGCPSTLDTFGLDGPCEELTAAYAQHACDEPLVDELQSSDEFKLVGQLAIRSTGQQRLLDVRAALASRFAVTMALHASDSRFQDYRGGVMGPPPDGSRCDHLTCVLATYTDVSGNTVLVGQNSWSKRWGEGGFFRCCSEVLMRSSGVHACSVRRV